MVKSPTKAMAKLIKATEAAAEATAHAMRTDWTAQRQEHWQRNHVKVISCKVSVEEHAAIMEQCRAAHCTRYALLRLLLAQYLTAVGAELESDTHRGGLEQERPPLTRRP